MVAKPKSFCINLNGAIIFRKTTTYDDGGAIVCSIGDGIR